MEVSIQVHSLNEAKQKLSENVVSVVCVQGDESKVITSVEEAQEFYRDIIQLND